VRSFFQTGQKDGNGFSKASCTLIRGDSVCPDSYCFCTT
jgi:hypothetical protein